MHLKTSNDKKYASVRFAMKGFLIFCGSRYTVHVTERKQRNCETGA